MNYFSDNSYLDFYLRHPDRPDLSEVPAAAQALARLGRIAAETIAPHADEADAAGPSLRDGQLRYAFPTQKNFSALAEAGLCGLCIGHEYGGRGLSRTVSLLATEVLARADLGFAALWGLQDCAEIIARFGSPEQRQRYLPRIAAGASCSMDLTEPTAGSDLQATRLAATHDEAADCWRLNGMKRFITNGGADIHLVLARTEPGTTDGRGLSLFLCDRSDGGPEVRRLVRKMGIRSTPTATLAFHNTPAQLVGDRRMGLIKYVMSLMNNARLGVAAQAAGLCEACWREAARYAAGRRQFGRPVSEQAQVADLLDAMRARTDAVRSLLCLAARQAEQAETSGQAARTAALLIPLAKLAASELANQCAYDCMQVFGGCGYMQGTASERFYRDARVLSLYEGTSQMQVAAAAKGIGSGAYDELLGTLHHRIATQPLDAMQHDCLNLLRQGAAAYRENRGSATADVSMEHRLRPLAEQTALLLMGYQLLLDSTYLPALAPSCHTFVGFAAEKSWRL